MYPVAGMWAFWLPMIMLGFSPVVVFSVVALNLAYQFFVHTETVGKLGWLEQVFNTPSLHRVHHATNPGYLDRNFAGVLVIWDKMFGTYVVEDSNKPCRYGIVGQIESNNPLYISLHQWIYMFKSAYYAKGWRQKAKVLFAYPTSSVEAKKQAE